MRARVAIIGGGITGLATAWALAARGVTDVVVVERGDLCGGATGKSSGVVRCHYGVASLAAMAWQGVHTFERAGEVFGDDIGFVQAGYVVGVGPADVAALEANVALQQSLGVDVALVDHDRVAAWWPEAHLEDFAAFAHEPRGGYGDAYRTGLALADAARRAGVVILPHTPVEGLTWDGGRVTGAATAGPRIIEAEAVVVAAGPWTPALCAPLGVDVPVRAQREQILVIEPGRAVGARRGERREPGDRGVLSDLVSLQYVRGERSGAWLVGNSDHRAPQIVDPDRYRNRADDDYTEIAVEKVARRFPGLADARLSHTYAGCYDVTPDFNPVLSATPVEGLFVCAGFSGHGFKLSPAAGRLVADLVLEGDSTDPAVRAADFRLSRFADGDLLVSAHRYVGAGQMR